MKNSVKKIIIGTACSAIAIAALSFGGVSAYKKTAEKNSIGSDTAFSVAIEDAGVNKENAQKLKSDFEREDGKFVYEVEFDAEGKEYDYIIDAKSGEVLEKESEKENIAPSASSPEITENTTAPEEEKTSQTDEPVSDTTTEAVGTTKPEDTSITLEKAKSIALANAGVKASNVIFTKARLDREDNCYDIEFVSGNKKCEYEVSVKSGRITDKEIENISVPSSDNKESSSVTLEKAKSIALANAGVKASNVTFTKARLDREDNAYDIEFVCGNKKYEYEVSAGSGRITDKEIENISVPAGDNKESSSVTLEKAKSIALADAGVTVSKATFTKAKLDREDNCYDIEFVSGNKKYEYEVSAKSGRITDKEIENISAPASDNKESSSVTLEKAKSIALANAGVTASKVTFTKAKLDREDNCYEIEFYTSSKKFEYEVSVKSGKIISKETESIKPADTQGDKAIISVDEAKQIALKKAGLKASDVRFIKAKLEREDGIQVYEIEFIKGFYEYEFEINASNGKILDYSREIDD